MFSRVDTYSDDTPSSKSTTKVYGLRIDLEGIINFDSMHLIRGACSYKFTSVSLDNIAKNLGLPGKTGHAITAKEADLPSAASILEYTTTMTL